MLHLYIIRIASLIYGVFVLGKKMLWAALVIGLILFLFYQTPIREYLVHSNSANMHFRDYDTVPNFSEYGYLGIYLRACIWPLIAVSGAFFLFSPSLAFLPVAMGSAFMQVYCLIVFRRPGLTFGAFIAMFVLATVVSGFTTYIRYVSPIIIVIPIILMGLSSNRGRVQNSVKFSVLLSSRS